MSTATFDDGPTLGGNVLLTDTYLLGRLIRRGGTSEIYEATHARLPGRYAVKILAPELAGNREAFARFCHEAEIMSELRHPNLVQIFDFNSAPDQRPYFVMEYLEGRDLGARLADPEPPTLPGIVRLVESVASALAAAHAHGVVHRDLKPANIFLVAVDGQPDGLVKVLDFGISKGPAATTRRSISTEIPGSPPYMSPEQVRGATAEIDGRTDQFALGAIAYRMLTGHDAFEATDASAMRHQIAHEPARPLAHHLPVAWDTRPLQAVLDRALAKDPADRWGGMMEMARAFEAAAERTLAPSSPEAASPDAASPEPPPVRFGGTPIESASEAAPIVFQREALAPMPMALEPELSDTLDRIPVKHHRMAATGAVALALVGLLAATGWYRGIPAALPRVRQSLAAWLQPKQPPRPASVTPPEPAVTHFQQPPASVAAASVVAAAGAPPVPQPEPPADTPTRESAPAARPDVPEPGAATEPRHHAARHPRFRGHPGSIELTPTAPADPASPAAPDGFPIEPPAALPDTPARDLIPPAEPESPPPSSSTGGAPAAPSTP